jgi:hypothetical protein
MWSCLACRREFEGVPRDPHVPRCTFCALLCDPKYLEYKRVCGLPREARLTEAEETQLFRQAQRGDIDAIAALAAYRLKLRNDSKSASVCARLREVFHGSCGYRPDKVEGEVKEQRRQRSQAAALDSRAEEILFILAVLIGGIVWYNLHA